MSAQHFEHFLARLYTDEFFLETFLSYPERLLKNAELTREERSALLAIDREGLKLAARSFRAKRKKRESKPKLNPLKRAQAFFATRIGW